MKIFSIKVSEQALAGKYAIELSNEQKTKTGLEVHVLPYQSFTAHVDYFSKFYTGEDPIHFNLNCTNKGNESLAFRLQIKGDPVCTFNYSEQIFNLAPHCSLSIPIQTILDAQINEKKQFVLLKILNTQTDEILYQDSLSFNINSREVNEEDEYDRIPSHLSFISFADNGDYVQAIEYAGSGIINFKRDRRLDFYFLLPTDRQNVSYGAEQRLFLGVSEPNWNLNFGDTVYTLSPLTQNFRYGRGAGIDCRNGPWTIGTHYTQNTFNNDYNPKESCGYIAYDFNPNAYLALNYLHKTLQCEPRSQLVTLESEIIFPKLGLLELELGKNFTHHVHSHQTGAYRIYAEGHYGKDVLYTIEKTHADPAFFGYYQNTDVFSTSLDFPIKIEIKALPEIRKV